MMKLSKQSLIYSENLTLPSVIVIKASVGCGRCQERICQIISRMTELSEYTVDVHNKEVILKGNFRNNCKGNDIEYLEIQMKGKCCLLRLIIHSFRASCFWVWRYICQ
ncbi:uncharacterized protein LOC119987041 isoform X2 [Tripterygium wilfordii]|uniref:uncharacterized protein LOC119987041 isoform X2 n=1 Tax=Tripterygium wilfordii TaxID=458696 RepID=UPI0018F837DB|nr:uncharacterized protein LOC119987041 isoform X2 [Tripterygium wilfordii]